MKFLLIATFVLGLGVGISASGGSFATSDLVTQSCDDNNKAQIVFFDTVRVSHPFGTNTCHLEDLHKIQALEPQS